MEFLLAAILVFAPFVVLMLAGEAPDRLGGTAGRKPAAPAPPVGAQRDDPPVLALTTDEQARCEVEGLLARQLLAGEIDRGAYQDAMAELAVRDARGRPLRVPGDPTG
jgi:hypothetical protein